MVETGAGVSVGNMYKIVVLGEGKYLYKIDNFNTARVGKSSITIKYCKDEFNEKQESTVDATFN